jgi:hypothetical protein
LESLGGSASGREDRLGLVRFREGAVINWAVGLAAPPDRCDNCMAHLDLGVGNGCGHASPGVN